jgi:hypothetical protein
VQVQSTEILLQALVVLRVRDRSLKPFGEPSHFLLATSWADHGCLESVGFCGVENFLCIARDEIGEGGAGIKFVLKGGLSPTGDPRCVGGGAAVGRGIGAVVEGGEG